MKCDVRLLFGAKLNGDDDGMLRGYELLETVGKGSYGKIIRARRIEDGEIVAIKKVRALSLVVLLFSSLLFLTLKHRWRWTD